MKPKQSSSSETDLYGPLIMPPALLKAHQKLDTAYQPSGGKKACVSDAERVAFLFELYQRITSFFSCGGRQENTKNKIDRKLTEIPPSGLANK